jgi:hypothetical protein
MTSSRHWTTIQGVKSTAKPSAKVPVWNPPQIDLYMEEAALRGLTLNSVLTHCWNLERLDFLKRHDVVGYVLSFFTLWLCCASFFRRRRPWAVLLQRIIISNAKRLKVNM